MFQMTDEEKAALERLLLHARGESGQSRRVADFLLAWWNATDCGGFDIATTWALDANIAADVVMVFALAVRAGNFPDALAMDCNSKQSCAIGAPV
jgi:predicted lipid carrier protein YhbT